MPKTSKDFNIFTDWGDHIKGPWESGDLVHSVLDTETTDIANNDPYPTILNADFILLITVLYLTLDAIVVSS